MMRPSAKDPARAKKLANLQKTIDATKKKKSPSTPTSTGNVTPKTPGSSKPSPKLEASSPSVASEFDKYLQPTNSLSASRSQSYPEHSVYAESPMKPTDSPHSREWKRLVHSLEGDLSPGSRAVLRGARTGHVRPTSLSATFASQATKPVGIDNHAIVSPSGLKIFKTPGDHSHEQNSSSSPAKVASYAAPTNSSSLKVRSATVSPDPVQVSPRRSPKRSPVVSMEKDPLPTRMTDVPGDLMSHTLDENTRLKGEAKLRDDEIRNLSHKAESLQRKLTAQESRTREKEEENKTLSSTISQLYSDVDRQRGQYNAQISSLRDEYEDQAKKLRNQLKEREIQYNHLENQNSQLQRQVNEMSRVEEERSFRLNEASQRWAEESEERSDTIHHLTTENSRLHSEISDMQARLNKVQPMYDAAEAQLKHLERTLELRAEELQDSLSENRQLSAKNVALRAELDDAAADRHALEHEMKTKARMLISAETEQATLGDRVARAESMKHEAVARIENLESALRNRGVEVEDLKQQLTTNKIENQRHIDRLKSEAAAAEERADIMHSECEQAKARSLELSSQMAALRTDLEISQVQSSASEKQGTELARLSQEKASMAAKMAEMQHVMENMKTHNGRLNAEVDRLESELESQKKEADHFRRRLEEEDRLLTASREANDKFTSSTMPDLQHKIQEMMMVNTSQAAEIRGLQERVSLLKVETSQMPALRARSKKLEDEISTMTEKLLRLRNENNELKLKNVSLTSSAAAAGAHASAVAVRSEKDGAQELVLRDQVVNLSRTTREQGATIARLGAENSQLKREIAATEPARNVKNADGTAPESMKVENSKLRAEVQGLKEYCQFLADEHSVKDASPLLRPRSADGPSSPTRDIAAVSTTLARRLEQTQVTIGNTKKSLFDCLTSDSRDSIQQLVMKINTMASRHANDLLSAGAGNEAARSDVVALKGEIARLSEALAKAHQQVHDISAELYKQKTENEGVSVDDAKRLQSEIMNLKRHIEEKGLGGDAPTELYDQISSLKEEMGKLSVENKQHLSALQTQRELVSFLETENERMFVDLEKRLGSAEANKNIQDHYSTMSKTIVQQQSDLESIRSELATAMETSRLDKEKAADLERQLRDAQDVNDILRKGVGTSRSPRNDLELLKKSGDVHPDNFTRLLEEENKMLGEEIERVRARASKQQEALAEEIEKLRSEQSAALVDLEARLQSTTESLSAEVARNKELLSENARLKAHVDGIQHNLGVATTKRGKLGQGTSTSADDSRMSVIELQRRNTTLENKIKIQTRSIESLRKENESLSLALGDGRGNAPSVSSIHKTNTTANDESILKANITLETTNPSDINQSSKMVETARLTRRTLALHTQKNTQTSGMVIPTLPPGAKLNKSRDDGDLLSSKKRMLRRTGSETRLTGKKDMRNLSSAEQMRILQTKKRAAGDDTLDSNDSANIAWGPYGPVAVGDVESSEPRFDDNSMYNSNYRKQFMNMLYPKAAAKSSGVKPVKIIPPKEPSNRAHIRSRSEWTSVKDFFSH